MKAFLEALVKGLVDDPDGVSVTEREERDGVLFEVRVTEGDLGKVIGRSGRIVNALRAVMASLAAGASRAARVGAGS